MASNATRRHLDIGVDRAAAKNENTVEVLAIAAYRVGRAVSGSSGTELVLIRHGRAGSTKKLTPAAGVQLRPARPLFPWMTAPMEAARSATDWEDASWKVSQHCRVPTCDRLN